MLAVLFVLAVQIDQITCTSPMQDHEAVAIALVKHMVDGNDSPACHKKLCEQGLGGGQLAAKKDRTKLHENEKTKMIDQKSQRL